MTKRMLIDATHLEETRVVVMDGNRVEEFDFESASHKPLKGNIYLAKVTRVEPSLQAAFVDYGGNRHGFLAFGEIHPDYYRIPIADREALKREVAEEEGGGNGEDDSLAEDAEEMQRRRFRMTRRYKIQEVVKRRQILLVQVTKEERGNKGAALTTYLSLAGRYCVLMPNTGRGGGISRKISNPVDRKRLKGILQDLQLPEGMSLILRTAGAERTKAEIKRDYEYLVRLWDDIREKTLVSTAPALIHEEGDIVKRAIRDLYSRDIEEVLVDGEEAYKSARSFMRMMIPSHAKRVKVFKEEGLPLFHRYKVEAQLDDIHNPVVQLKSGGYIVLNPTEALVAIDVNSGRSTRERNIEETALRTNMEAAHEVARQLRLRDLAGLVVIDFIDMEESRHNAQVERALKEAMKSDRARLQIGRISNFGLLEMSRQRLRTSLVEASSEQCAHCRGTGLVRSVESSALHLLRAIEEEGLRGKSSEISVMVPTRVALYALNVKRRALGDIERRYDFVVHVSADDSLIQPEFKLERLVEREGPPPRPAESPKAAAAAAAEAEVEAEEEIEVEEEIEAEEETSEERAETGTEDGRRRRRPRRRRGGREERPAAAPAEAEAASGEDAGQPEEQETDEAARATDSEAEGEGEGEGEGENGSKRRRRRGRRGGRRRARRPEGEASPGAEEAAEAAADGEGEPVPASTAAADDTAAAQSAADAAAPEEPAAEDVQAEVPEKKPAPKRRSRARRPKAEADASVGEEAASVQPAADEAAAAAATEAAETPAMSLTEPELIPAAAETQAEKPAEPQAVPKPEPDEPLAAQAQDEDEPARPGNGAGDEPAPSPEDARPAEPAAPPPPPVEEPSGPPRRGWWNRLVN